MNEEDSLRTAHAMDTDAVNRIVRECGIKPPDGIKTGDTWDIAQSVIDLVARLVARLREYARHSYGCSSNWCGLALSHGICQLHKNERRHTTGITHSFEPQPCSCGLAELLEVK